MNLGDPPMRNIAACAVAFNITIASMPAAGWPQGADATAATVVAPWPEGAEAWVEAQMAPRRLFRAPQDAGARTTQRYQLAAAKHTPEIDPHAAWVSNGSPPFDYSAWRR